MPKATPAAVIWSAADNIYRWHPQGQIAPLPLSSAHDLRTMPRESFAFQGRQGHLTARKETRRHGEGYWYAYRNQGKQTLKGYLRRTEDLTFDRLEEVAARLQARIAPDNGSDHQAPLLAPKLQIPPLREALVPRDRLLCRLEEGLAGKLTLLSAPAGFGKTTLVGQWVAMRRAQAPASPIAWVSLDAGDDELFRFWHYLCTATQRFRPGLGESAWELIRTSRQPTRVMRSALTLFLNELSQLPEPALLVVEDYHLITAPLIHETLTFLIDHLPPTLHLILTARSDPPLPLARWRGRNELAELRAADLRLSPSETQRFFQGTLPEAADPEMIQRLDTKLEGWAAGLHLVSLALHERHSSAEIERFIGQISGDQRTMLEYFITEVLETQPESTQRFLLQTSILSRLAEDLCEVVTGIADDGATLRSLTQANVFLRPFDEAGHWYRYHPLFAEAMRAEARRRLGIAAMHASLLRASDWFMAQAMLPEAVEAALDAQAYPRAAAIVEALIGQSHMHEMYEHHTLRRWLGTIPDGVLGQHPLLCMRSALLLLFASDADRGAPTAQSRIEHLLQLAEAAWQGDTGSLAEVQVFRALLASEQGDPLLAAGLARQALTALPPQSLQWRGTCLGFLGAEAVLNGQLYAAGQIFQEALALYEAAGNHYATRAGKLALGDLALTQGSLRQASALFQGVLDGAREDRADRDWALLGLATCAYAWNDMETADRQAQQALDLGSELGDMLMQAHATLIAAQVAYARGQSPQAHDVLATMLARMSARPLALLRHDVRQAQAGFWLMDGYLAAVEQWVAARAEETVALPGAYQEGDDLLIVRLRIAQGDPETALSLLERWRLEAHAQGRIRSAIEIAALQAVAHQAQGDHAAAMNAIELALALAHPEQQLRILLDEGAAIIPLLRAAVSATTHGTFARSLLSALGQQQLGQIAPLSSIPVTSEPLSPQEQRVLQLLGEGYSNAEIAAILVVSLNTVKTHVQSIYRKLAIHRRQEARDLARGLSQRR